MSLLHPYIHFQFLPSLTKSPFFYSILLHDYCWNHVIYLSGCPDDPDFDPAPGADMWKLSNPPPLLCATLMASLDVSHCSFIESISRIRGNILLTPFFSCADLQSNIDGRDFTETVPPDWVFGSSVEVVLHQNNESYQQQQ